MKIAWFHSHLLHPNSGGTRYVTDYCRALAVRGHQVTVFCDVAENSVRGQLAAGGVRLVEMDVRSTNSPLYWLFLPLSLIAKRSRFKSEIREFDFAIATMFPMNILIAGLKIPKIQICYAPFAFFYDKSFLKNFNFAQRAAFFVLGSVWRFWDRRAISRMDELLTINKTMVPIMRNLFRRSCKILPGWVKKDSKVDIPEEEKRRLRRQYPSRILIFHSTDMTALKGTLPFLEVLGEVTKVFTDFKLLISVYVDLPEQIRKLCDRIRALGLEQNVEYIGCLPKEKLPLYYASVDFVAQPSFNQPLSWPLNESLKYGTPIIGGPMSEETLHKVNGVMIDVANKRESVDSLLWLFENRDSLDTGVNPFGDAPVMDENACLSYLEEILRGLPGKDRWKRS